MSSEYDFVQRGSLKLKGVADGGVKKKKKSKSKNKDRDEPKISKELLESVPGSSSSEKQNKNEVDAEKYYKNKTKTEIAFLKKKEETDIERIRKKGSESHKERVEKYNAHLNSLSEHYEPAKVSWTK